MRYMLIHTADPVAFFEPLDLANERLDELGAYPDWWFGRPGLPTFARLLGARLAGVADPSALVAGGGNAAVAQLRTLSAGRYGAS